MSKLREFIEYLECLEWEYPLAFATTLFAIANIIFFALIIVTLGFGYMPVVIAIEVICILVIKAICIMLDI